LAGLGLIVLGCGGPAGETTPGEATLAAGPESDLTGYIKVTNQNCDFFDFGTFSTHSTVNVHVPSTASNPTPGYNLEVCVGDRWTGDIPIGESRTLTVGRWNGGVGGVGIYCEYKAEPTGTVSGTLYKFNAQTKIIYLNCQKSGLICGCSESGRSATIP